MAQPTGQEHQIEIYIRSKFPTDFAKGPRNTLGQGVALYLEAMQWPVDIPDREEDVCAQYGITDYIPAVIGENLFYWLTTNEITTDDDYQKTMVSFMSDGVTTDVFGSRLHKSGTPGLVRVVVESAPTQRAMDVAQRLWSLFFDDASFEVLRKKYGEDGQLLDVSEPDLVVHRCFPIEEPQIFEISESGLAKATFRLQLLYSRST